MKASLLTAAALASLLALSGCAAASSDGATAPSAGASTRAATSSAPAASATEAAAHAAPSSSAPAAASSQAAASTEGKVHFTGDYTKTTAADSDKILELSKQWHSPEKEAALRAKMASAGLSSNIPADMAGEWYSRAATACQARFDGHTLAVQGVWLEIDNLVRATYCPELG